MKSIWLGTDGLGRSRLRSLPLPFLYAGPTTTDHDRAHMAPPELAREVTAVTAIRHPDGPERRDKPDRRRLVFLASGRLAVETVDSGVVLGPGDALFVDALGSACHTVTFSDDCCVLEVDVAEGWTPQGAVAPDLDERRRGPAEGARIAGVFVDNETPRFRGLPSLFSTGSPTPQPVHAMSLLCLSPDVVGDPHTEPATSLVMVLSGGFELQVGGEQSQIFQAGDICLVEDHHGQGHGTRTHGETRICALILPDDHQWA